MHRDSVKYCFTMFFMDKIEVLKKALGDDAIIDLKTLREEYEKAKKLVEEETD